MPLNAMRTSAAVVVFLTLTPRTCAEDVVIRKVGFPMARFEEKPVCGQRHITYSAWNSPEYLQHLLQGFRAGTCEDIGYKNFETSVNYSEHLVPFTAYHNVTVDVFSRDIGFIDVAGCVYRECLPELSAMGSSNYVGDVAHCISPAFGPCAPKAWTCLDDDVCRSAVECLPSVAKECGQKFWTFLQDEDERKMLMCITECNNSKTCVLTKCGKAALSCFIGTDKLCHEALTCIPWQLMECSVPAFHCIFDWHSECRDNLRCLVSGANTCADPGLNLLTDSSIPQLMTCANKKCPAPSVDPSATDVLALPGPDTMQALNSFGNIDHAALKTGVSSWPMQLACMNLKCGFKMFNLLMDKDIQAVATCFAPAIETCGSHVWNCLGDAKCRSTVECWANGTEGQVSDVWKMVTDKHERTFLELLTYCVTSCGAETNPLKKGLCASKCGLQSTKCVADTTCRSVFDDLPIMAGKCGIESLKDPAFKETAQCIGHMAADCGRAGIELVRDQKLAEMLACNNKCTREPSPGQNGAAEIVV